ncbi:MAG: hypothetical protein ACYCOO_04815 [Chitinophagaceae bacterium]
MLKIIRTDHSLYGLMLGLAAPILGFLIYYLFKFYPTGISLRDFFLLFVQHQYLIPPVLSLCVLLNALIFFGYTHFRKDLTARGILAATLIYALIIILIKLR